MHDPSSQFVGSIPEHYDQVLGPHLFVDYAADLSKRASRAGPHRVLELAAGTGLVTRVLRDALPPASSITMTDLNPPMLEVARAKFTDDEAVAFQDVDATSLPFDDGSFEAVVCQFGVMFFPDKPTSFKEAARVLCKGGRYHFNVWDRMEKNPFSIVAHETAARFFDEDPPQFYTVPFSYHDVDEITHELETAGFSAVEHEHVTFEKPIPDAEHFAQGIVFGNPLFDEIRDRGGDPSRVKDAVREALEARFGRPGTMPLSAFVFEAVR